MTAGSAEAFAEELRRATAALEGISRTLDDAQLGRQGATEAHNRLLALRNRVRLNTSASLEAMAELRRDLRTARRSLRRPLIWRIRTLRMRLVWRVMRVALLALLMVGLLLFAVVWVARNRDWLMETLLPGTGEVGLEASDPTTANPGGQTDPTSTQPVSPPPAGGQP